MAAVPQEWAAYGARFGRDGLLYLSEWRRGFTVHELRALFFTCQEVTTLRRELDLARRERDELADRLDQVEQRCAWYRRQLVLESRLGLALLRIADG